MRSLCCAKHNTYILDKHAITGPIPDLIQTDAVNIHLILAPYRLIMAWIQESDILHELCTNWVAQTMYKQYSWISMVGFVQIYTV